MNQPTNHREFSLSACHDAAATRRVAAVVDGSNRTRLILVGAQNGIVGNQWTEGANEGQPTRPCPHVDLLRRCTAQRMACLARGPVLGRVRAMQMMTWPLARLGRPG